ncbi:BA75_02202T0 [Komagataella pastoris]|uniref:BA75_02202T0 n=1 Tax=Komagataella pastoris TaxID=4922 RepID=A0A1B2JC76_PICPA|nr:BA75_02202T0 [Komagataella pastoris]
MQSLLLDGFLSRISPKELLRIETEASYNELSLISDDSLNTATRNVKFSQGFKFDVHPHKNSISCLDLETMNSQFLLSGSTDSSLKLWNIRLLQEKKRTDDYQWQGFYHFKREHLQSVTNLVSVPRKTIHDFGISHLQWWPFDPGMFVTGSYDHSVKVFDTENFEQVFSFDLKNKVYNFDINATGQHVLVGVASESPMVKLLDLRTTSDSHILKGHKSTVLSVKWSPTDSNVIATGDILGKINMWDIRRSKSCVCELDQYNTTGNPNPSTSPVETVKAHQGAVNGIQFNELGSKLVSCGLDEKIRSWDLTQPGGVNELLNFGPLIRNKSHQYKKFILSPSTETDLQFLLFPNDNGELLVYRLANGKLVKRLTKGNKVNLKLNSIVYTGFSSATYITGDSKGNLDVWGPQSEYEIHQSEGETGCGEGSNVLDDINDELIARKKMKTNPF